MITSLLSSRTKLHAKIVQFWQNSHYTNFFPSPFLFFLSLYLLTHTTLRPSVLSKLISSISKLDEKKLNINRLRIKGVIEALCLYHFFWMNIIVLVFFIAHIKRIYIYVFFCYLKCFQIRWNGYMKSWLSQKMNKYYIIYEVKKNHGHLLIMPWIFAKSIE